MQCDKFEQRLHALLDRREPAEYDRLLLAHARSCPACAELMATQEMLFDALSGDVARELSEDRDPNFDGQPDFAWQVVREAMQGPMPPRPRPRRELVAAAVAALVLLALWPLFPKPTRHAALSDPSGRMTVAPDRENRLNSSNRPRATPGTRSLAPSTGLATTRRQTPATPGADRRVASAPPGLAEAGSLGSQANGPQANGPQANGPQPSRPGSPALDFGELPPFLAELQDESLAQVDQLTVGLRPLASSFSMALDALRRTFPISRENRPDDRRADCTAISTVHA